MNIVIGLEINTNFAQVSYVAEGQLPKTLELSSKGEKANYPTALCRRNEVSQWFYGHDAVQRSLSGEGPMVENLFAHVLKEDSMTLAGESYRTTDLCKLFVKAIVKRAILKVEEQENEAVTVMAMVVSLEPWSDEWINKIPDVFSGLVVPLENIYLQGHEESIYSYLIHQPGRLLGYETAILSLEGEQLTSYRVEMNHKTKPVVTTIQKEEPEGLIRRFYYPSIMEHDAALKELDIAFADYMTGFLKDRLVTSVYLIGEGFRGEWYQSALPLMCRNRKVYAGNHLFSQGAALAASQRVWPGVEAENFQYLGRGTLQYNVGLKLFFEGKEEYFPMIDAGLSWYEANASLSFTMEQAKGIALYITPILNGRTYEKMIELCEKEERAFRAYRYHLEFSMKSEKLMEISICDEGFGDFYKPQEELTITIDLSEMDEYIDTTDTLHCCVGNKSLEAYVMKPLATKVYTLEEICYYICENAEMLDNDFMQEEMAAFIEGYLGLSKLGNDLRQLIHFGGSLHTYCQMILEQADYLPKQQMDALIEEIKKAEDMPVPMRLMNQAGLLLQKKEYFKAIKAYSRLLGDAYFEENHLIAEIYMGIGKASAGLFYFQQAADAYEKAYQISGQKECLEKFLLCKRFLLDRGQYVTFTTENDAYYETALLVEQQYERMLSQLPPTQNLSTAGMIEEFETMATE